MRKLFDLARANAGKGAGIRSEKTGDDSTSIYVYDIIDDWWGVSAGDFAREVAAVTTPNVLLRVNSGGGDVFAARAMMIAIAESPAKFTAKIDGLAASAATALTLACDSVEIAEGGFYMIHKAWTWAMGNADDMRANAALLDKIDGVLRDGYAARTGMAGDEIIGLMKAESWYSAEEAVAAGFADSIMAIQPAAKAQAQAYNLAVYDHVPKALTATPADPTDDDMRQRVLVRLGLYERTAA